MGVNKDFFDLSVTYEINLKNGPYKKTVFSQYHMLVNHFDDTFCPHHIWTGGTQPLPVKSVSHRIVFIKT